jgi:hypothetical protein
MKIASLGIAVALGAAPVVAHAQVSVSGGITFNLGSIPGEPVASVDVFYDQLSPYGVWIDDPVVGQAFIPDQANYVPYTNGHWEMTDVGFVWISSEPFAWATSHYGRWFYSDDYGRWVWVPDTTWGPNWVDWYEADGNFGWAPLAPDIVIEAGYSTPTWAYRFCPSDRLLATDVDRYYVPRDRVEVIRRDARPISHREQAHNHQVIVGPSQQALQAHRIQARPKKADVRTVGRMNASDLRAAEQRAETRKPQLERQNAQRLEQHAQIKRAVETRATKAPANRSRTDMNRTQQNRNEQNRTQPENRAQPNAAQQNRNEQNRNEPNRTQPANRAQPQNRTQQPARPESRGVTPGANDRGNDNRARPDRANDQPNDRGENHAPAVRPDENPAEPKSVPLTPPTQERTPARPEPKAAPSRRPRRRRRRPRTARRRARSRRPRRPICSVPSRRRRAPSRATCSARSRRPRRSRSTRRHRGPSRPRAPSRRAIRTTATTSAKTITDPG